MSNPGEELDMSRRPTRPRRLKLNIEPVEILVDAKDAIGKWVRYYSWTERTKFLIKSIDLINKKIFGIYVMDGNEVKGTTTFNLCKGIATRRINDYWYLIDGKRVDFSLDDKLFEI
jgi:hypothetical protein